jgi:uncharacterized membrane protein HdeD (DUF308 family)
MIRLALLLLGPQFIRSRWGVLTVIGLLWAALGVAVFIDGLDGDLWFPVRLVGYLLILEAIVTLVATTSNLGTQTVLRKGRGVWFLIVGVLIIEPARVSDFILAFLFGVIFLIDGGLRISAAWVVRFPHWRVSLVMGILELLFAVFMFEPYPDFYRGTVAYCVGAALVLSGLGCVVLSLRLRRLPANGSLAALFARNHRVDEVCIPVLPLHEHEGEAHSLTVHVWTPAGSAKDPLPQPLIDRYVAAVDGMGVISTGHSALELAPDLYISHYPDVEIDHSPQDFRHLLRATADNNVAGKFQPSYAVESSAWCASTAQVQFERFDARRLRAFWKVYSRDHTYNLTNRNCSSTVAEALESALEGTLGKNGPTLHAFISSLLNPELWVAAQLREHAEFSAWTPGLMLDYARALRVAINPPPLGLVTLSSLAVNMARAHRRRRAFIAEARTRALAAALSRRQATPGPAAKPNAT